MNQTLSPLVDRDGVMLDDARGVPLATDSTGLVYTMQNGRAVPMGALAEDEAGHIVIARVEGLSALDPRAKGRQLLQAGSKRARARGKLRHWEGELTKARAANLADGHPRVVNALRRIDHWKTRVAHWQGRVDAINAEPLEGLGDGGGVADLGAFSTWWKKNKGVIGGVAAGAAGTALVGSAINPASGFGQFVRQVPTALKQFFIQKDPVTGKSVAVPVPAGAASASPAGAGMPESMPVMQAGMGGMDTKTLLLLGGLGLGAMLLMRKQ